jgi:hypothetical protein
MTLGSRIKPRCWSPFKELESGLTYLPAHLQNGAKAHMSDLLVRVILRTKQLREDQRPN